MVGGRGWVRLVGRPLLNKCKRDGEALPGAAVRDIMLEEPAGLPGAGEICVRRGRERLGSQEGRESTWRALNLAFSQKRRY
jgi:hypothetical protein